MIGVLARNHEEEHGYYSINKEIIKVIKDYGFLPLPILYDGNTQEEFQRQKPLIEQCDGFILQGGTMYEKIDLDTVKYLYQKDIPVLGICLGMQTMAMAFHGKMGTRKEHFGTTHSIKIEPNSRLFQILNKEYIIVNSRHHDYIEKTSLMKGVICPIIEEVEDENKLFFVGVQWHPESLRDENSEKIFSEFFKCVRKYKNL